MSVTFILGNHRSGTTWLYQLMAATGAFSVLTAHHVIAWPQWQAWARGDGAVPDRAEMALRFERSGARVRIDDGVPLSPDLPEEYGYILNNAGMGSRLTRHNAPLLRSMIDVLARDGRPVLLKNPWDYGNFRMLHAMFPDARFVFIHRHPWRVVHSLSHMFQTLFVARDPYSALLSQRYVRNWDTPWRRRLFQWLAGPGFGWTLEGVAFGIAAANRHYTAQISTLPAGRSVALRYEDLCAEPEHELARVLQFCAVNPTVPAVPPRRGDRSIHPLVLARAPRLALSMKVYFRQFGYAVDGGVEAAPACSR
jgi:hypothetical protein